MEKPERKARFKTTAVCKECGECDDMKLCAPVRKPLRKYQGIRFTADGFDCALPVAFDSHSVCSYKCLYCFSNFLGGHGRFEIGQLSLNRLERILDGSDKTRMGQAFYQALKRRSKRPCPIQYGALTDPFDNIERNQGWALQVPKLMAKYSQPCRISTKGTLLRLPEYLDAYSEAAHLFWVAFSLITPDDELLKKIDRYAPNATERLATMKALSSRGISVSLRLRPAIPQVSDSTPKHPKAYKELIERAAEAGARAISMEVLFVPGVLTGRDRFHWMELENLIGLPIQKIYKELTPRFGSCIRPDRSWTEDFVHSCYDVAKKNGLDFGISDPVWKELNDFGCCCGIPPDDPVFGNWERENATNVVVEAKKAYENGGKNKTWGVESILPPWSNNVALQDMVMVVGTKGVLAQGITWKDKLTNIWNDLKSNRGPLKYFQGILRPTKLDKNGSVRYKYHPMPRRHVKSLWET